MSEKKSIKKTKKNFSAREKWGFFLILIILVVVGFLLFRWFSVPDRETFAIRKKDDDKISIYGLNEEQVRKIDWQKGATWTEHYYDRLKQYSLQEKEGNFFQRLIKKPRKS